MADEQAPVQAPPDEKQPLAATEPYDPGAAAPAESKPRVAPPLIKPVIAFTQLALAIILFGLIAYQAYVAERAVDGVNSSDSNSTVYNGFFFPPEAGLNNAGIPMLFFGLIFAVLQGVTGIAMAVQLTRASRKLGQGAIAAVLQVEMAMGFLAMGLACRHINLGVPPGAETTHMRITHTIEAYLIINWFVTVIFSIITMCGLVNWDSEGEQLDKLTRQHALSVTELLAALILIGLFAGHYQALTSGRETPTQAGLNGVTGTFMETVGVLFAVLMAISGFTMYQQVMGKGAPAQNEETVSALLRITLAFGVLAFGFACRHIYIGFPDDVDHGSRALVIAIESWVIINFWLTLFIHFDVRNHDWRSVLITEGKRLNPAIFGIVQVFFGIILIGLLAAEMQDYTGGALNGDAGVYGLNGAGWYMIGFGLIFAVFETAAGFAMLERTVAVLKRDASPNAAFVTNKVALAIGVLAMGFACRHIDLFLMNGAPQGASSHSVALVHAIESFLIINFFITWAIQKFSPNVDW